MDLRDELNSFYRRRKGIEIETFNEILNQCIKQIKYENEHTKQETHFTIPSFIIGKPVFDVKACCDFIVKKLKEQHITTKKICNNLLYISWKDTIDHHIPPSQPRASQKSYDYEDLKLFSTNSNYSEKDNKRPYTRRKKKDDY